MGSSIIRRCNWCNKEYKVWSSYFNRGDGKYCSKKCSDEKMASTKIKEKFCLTCGKKLSWAAKYAPKRNIKYCIKCFGKSPEFLEKVSKSWFKKGVVVWNKGLKGFMAKEKNVNWNGGKPKCIDCGKVLGGYQSTRCYICAPKYQSGKNHPNWKGGISPFRTKIYFSKEYKLWRESVFIRDNYTCVKCLVRGGNGKKVILNADHIKPFAIYPELRFAIDNGQTLCVECHRLKTSIEGKIYWKNQFSSGLYKGLQVLGIKPTGQPTI